MTDRPGLLTADGVTVLLVYGAEIKVARDDQPGIRITAGYHDGTVLLEAIGFEPRWGYEALRALDEAVQACYDAGLDVSLPPRRMSDSPARIVNRKV